MKQIFSVAFILLFTTGLVADRLPGKHVVFLKDKNNNPYSVSSPSEFLSQRAINRRLLCGIPITGRDLPVTPSYIDQIRGTGAPVVYSLKWFNAVVIETDNQSILDAVAALSITDHIDQVYPKKNVSAAGKNAINELKGIPPYTMNAATPFISSRPVSGFDYGQADNQVRMIAVDQLHARGFTGRGICIAILDAGFRHADTISAFDSLRDNNLILGTRDFNMPGNNVFADTMESHGTSVLSAMGANLPGQIVGTAPHASYWLIRTEVTYYEALIEEYNWAAGAEFADSVGADIINSSLGYTTFTDSVYDHCYAEMNGKSTPVTCAADMAASRGMMVVNSAGNDCVKPWHYIGAPADGDSVFTIGAVDAQGAIAYFSSRGPTADGRIKPDVAAQGVGATVVSGTGSVTQGSGTSFSSPIMAGAMASLWQAVPGVTAEDLRNAVRQTASRASQPDSLMGFGIPNMMDALTILSVHEHPSGDVAEYSIYPVPFSDSPWIRSNTLRNETATIEIHSITGQLVRSSGISMNGTSTVKLNSFSALPSGLYLVRIITGSGEQVLRAVKL